MNSSIEVIYYIFSVFNGFLMCYGTAEKIVTLY